MNKSSISVGGSSASPLSRALQPSFHFTLLRKRRFLKGAASKIPFVFSQGQANKTAARGIGSQAGNTNVSYHGVGFFADKCCLVANA